MPGKLSEGDTISTGEHLSLVAKKRGGTARCKPLYDAPD